MKGIVHTLVRSRFLSASWEQNKGDVVGRNRILTRIVSKEESTLMLRRYSYRLEYLGVRTLFRYLPASRVNKKEIDILDFSLDGRKKKDIYIRKRGNDPECFPKSKFFGHQNKKTKESPLRVYARFLCRVTNDEQTERLILYTREQ